VRVNGLLWQEVLGLYEQPDSAQVYSTSTGEDGRRLVQFATPAVGGAVCPPPGQRDCDLSGRRPVAGRVRRHAITRFLTGYKD